MVRDPYARRCGGRGAVRCLSIPVMTKEGEVQKKEISEYILDQYPGLVAVIG